MKPGTRERLVVGVALAMCVAQLGFRAWALSGAWFQYDDFEFMSRVLNEPLGWSVLFDGYNSHLMPAGFLLTWANTHFAPLDFTPAAVEMLGMLALGSIGAVVFLCSAFGRRPGILVPLGLYLATVFTLPANTWWAAGVNQLPGLAALFWGGWTHLTYLRTRRFGWAVATMLITLAGLAFQEKTLLVYWLYLFLAVAYFAEGKLVRRLFSLARTYRNGVLLYGAVGTAYCAFYVSQALSFDPAQGNRQPVGPLLAEMIGDAYSTGVFGGPFRWATATKGVFTFADPGQIVTGLAVLALVLLGTELAAARTRSRRAWLLVGVALLMDAFLLAASRLANFGTDIGREYRFITELSAFTAVALGLATMRLRGAPELVVPTEHRGVLVGRPWRVAVVAVAVCALGTYSSVRFVQHWDDQTYSKTFFAHLQHDLTTSEQAVPVVDAPVPDRLFPGWALLYPDDSASHVLAFWRERAYFPDIANDRLLTIDDDGHLVPVVMDPVRESKPSTASDCPYDATDRTVTVPLDGPVLGAGWWARATYVSTGITTLHVKAGDLEHTITTKSGLHSLFFTAEGDGFDNVTFRTDDAAANVCIGDVVIGGAVAAGSDETNDEDD